ncbi:MAG: DUF3332 family protein [Candidatus Cloacimonadaceae bacterium]
MKPIMRLIALLVVVVMLVNLTGCYGSFALTKKVYEWNGTFGDKWIDSIGMWVLMMIPVYNFANFIDIVILNPLEFWTGSNPVTMKEGQQLVKYASGKDAVYKIVTTKNKLSITEVKGPDKGKTLTLTYVPETGNWTMSDGSNQTLIVKVTKDNLKLIYPNGNEREVKVAR